MFRYLDTSQVVNEKWFVSTILMPKPSMAISHPDSAAFKVSITVIAAFKVNITVIAAFKVNITVKAAFKVSITVIYCHYN